MDHPKAPRPIRAGGTTQRPRRRRSAGPEALRADAARPIEPNLKRCRPARSGESGHGPPGRRGRGALKGDAPAGGAGRYKKSRGRKFLVRKLSLKGIEPTQK